MEFIQNKSNGSQLDRLNEHAVIDATEVVAAVAYVSDSATLIESCRKSGKSLKLYARYDFTAPVSPEIIQWFRSRRDQSLNYELRFVGDIFHPKVIWWKGVGAYIGSANLSRRAWGGNIEAGVFLSEEELEENEMRADIEEFFAEVARLSHPLNDELAAEILRLASGPFAEAEYKAEADFEKTRLIPRQLPLNSVTKVPSAARNKAEFLKEWSETLQYLRDLGTRLTLAENRPAWLPENVSPGVLADQFLHAFYYNRVRDGQSYPYEACFRENQADKERAVQTALAYWQSTPSAPSNEDEHIRHWAPEVRELLSSESLKRMTVEKFEELCLRVHAVRDHAKRVSSTSLGLQQGMHRMQHHDRIRMFARWLFNRKSPDGSTTCQVIDYVLHTGKDGVPDRIFNACFGERKRWRRNIYSVKV